MARPRLHDDALRDRLLQVAAEAVATAGTSGVTVRDVAERAGTSASAVYSLFGGRAALVRAVGDAAFAGFAAHLAEVPRTDDPRADLLALGLAYREHALTHPRLYRVMFSTSGAGAQDPGREAATQSRSFAALEDGVRRVLAHGQDAPAAPDAREPALGLWALVHGLVELELDGLLPGTPAEQAARYTAVLRAAGPAVLAAGPGPGTAGPGALSEGRGTVG